MVIRYSLPTLLKKVMVSGGRLQWVTTTPPEEAIEALTAAAGAAYPPVDPDVATLDYGGPGSGEGGPVLYIHRCEARWIGEHFVTGIAAALEEAGFSGRLREGPRYLGPVFHAPGMVLAALVELDWDALLGAGPNYAGIAEKGWWVDPNRTTRVLPPWLEWTTSVAPTCLIIKGGTEAVPSATARDVALAAVAKPQLDIDLSIVCVSRDGKMARSMSIESEGFVTLQSWGPDRPGTAHGADLIQLALPAADDLTNAFIRGATFDTRDDVLKRPSPPPWRDAVGWRPDMTHLHDRFLYDAHGWQLVSGAHLSRIGDLDPNRWSVEQVATDRYTITARDLAPWLEFDPSPFERDERTPRDPTPPTAVLNQARRDFANGLISRQVTLDNPFPAFRTT